jgi:hypothetical protein
MSYAPPFPFGFEGLERVTTDINELESTARVD